MIHGKLQEFYDARQNESSPLHTKAIKLFGTLPEISEEALQKDPMMLVRLGIWDSMPQGWGDMIMSKRYMEGREVLVRIKACNLLKDKAQYMAYDPNGKEEFTSHRGVI